MFVDLRTLPYFRTVMKHIFAINIGEKSNSVLEALPLALKTVWKRLLPYSVSGVFWSTELTEKEISQLEKLGFRVTKPNAIITDNFVFYREPFEELNLPAIKEVKKFERCGVGIVIGIEHGAEENTVMEFVNYLKRGISLFNGHLFGGGTFKSGYYITGFVPSGNIYLLQESLHAMKIALEVYGLTTKAIFYLSRFNSIEYEGKEIYMFERTFVDFIDSLKKIKGFEILTEKTLLAKYPSMRTGIILKPTIFPLLNRKFQLVEGVYKSIDVTKRIVDRNDELSKLLTITKEALLSKKMVYMGLTGPYGIGKTSLAIEILRNEFFIEHKVNTHYIDFERGFKGPLYGIKKIFEALSPPPDFGVPPEDPLHINARLAYIMLKELTEREKLEEDIPPESKMKLIKLGFDRFIEYLNIPTIMVLDDIEFMDDTSREVLYDILRSAKGQSNPLIILLISRKKELIQDFDNIHIIELGPISRTKPGIPEMVLNAEVEKKVSDYIYKITSGHPFYMEQLTKYLKEEKIIGEKEGVYIFLAKPPSKIQTTDIIKRRMQSLSEEVSYILNIATLQDATLPLSFYSAILDKEEGVSISPKETINSNELMVRLVDRLNEIFYISRYAVFRKIRLEEILKSTKKNLHEKIVEVIESKFKDDLDMSYPVLVHHAKEAGLKEKEIYYLKKLYKEASNFSILPDCVKYLKRLLEIDKDNRITYLKELASVYGERGEWGKAQDILNTLIQTSDNPKILAFAYREKSYIETFQGNFKEAHKLIDMSMGVSLKSRNFEDVAGAYLTKGTIYWAEGKIKKAEENYRKALEVVMSHNIKGRNCTIYADIGFILFETGKVDDAIKWYFDAMQTCKDEKDYGSLANLYGNIAAVYQKKKNFEEAKKYVLYSMDIARQKGYLQNEARSHLQLASINMGLNDLKKAQDEANRALEIFKEIGDVLGVFKTLLELGRIASKSGEISHAIAHFVHALDTAGRLNNPNLKIDAYIELASVHEGEKAIKYLGLAYKEAVSSDSMERFTHIAIKLARKFKEAGKSNEALRVLKDALVRAHESQKRILLEEIERLRR